MALSPDTSERRGEGLSRSRPADFGRQYAAVHPHALATAMAVLRDRLAAEDVVQDVFAELWRRPEKFDPSRGTLRVYVCLLARSRAVDRTRSEASRRRGFDTLTASVAHDRPVQAPADPVPGEERAGLMSLVEALPRRQREAVLLAYGAELSSREISDVVGIPLGTAKSRVRLGLRKLRHSAGRGGRDALATSAPPRRGQAA